MECAKSKMCSDVTCLVIVKFSDENFIMIIPITSFNHQFVFSLYSNDGQIKNSGKNTDKIFYGRHSCDLSLHNSSKIAMDFFSLFISFGCVPVLVAVVVITITEYISTNIPACCQCFSGSGLADEAKTVMTSSSIFQALVFLLYNFSTLIFYCFFFWCMNVCAWLSECAFLPLVSLYLYVCRLFCRAYTFKHHDQTLSISHTFRFEKRKKQHTHTSGREKKIDTLVANVNSVSTQKEVLNWAAID